MAAVDLKSQLITDFDASPVVKHGPLDLGGVIRETVGTVQTNSDDSADSTYRMVRLPSRARVTDLVLSSDDSGSTGDTDVGIYLSDEGAAVDVDLFAADVDINNAALNESRVLLLISPEDMGKQLWELAGESEDPNVMYDITLTLTEAVTAATDISLKARYILDD